MKYFLDTEFIEYPCTIDLISIGIVAEDGREFYAINKECDYSKASQWVKENVLDKLPPPYYGLDPAGGKYDSVVLIATYPYMTRAEIAAGILEFTRPSIKPEFWGYYADYDWVVFCWLFGTMMQLPKGYPMYCRDIKQLCNSLGNPELPKQTGRDHHALEDALHHKKCFEYLMSRGWLKND